MNELKKVSFTILDIKEENVPKLNKSKLTLKKLDIISTYLFF